MKRGPAAAFLEIDPGRGTPGVRAPRAFGADLLALVRTRAAWPGSQPPALPGARALALAGALMVVAHPLLYLLWTRWLPQPHEDPPLRLLMALGGMALLLLAAGAGLGLLARSLRRRQIEQTLAAMGTAVRELRTPLATLRLVAQSLRQVDAGHDAAARLSTLTQRLEGVLHRLDRQVETQLANADLLRAQHGSERMGAAELVQAVLCDFPFRSAREASFVHLRVLRDFQCVGTRQLYFQAIDNLVRNALRSLACCPQAGAGDLLLEIDEAGGIGRIRVTDRGLGIAAEAQARLFQPFASAEAAGGVGLGLAFCLRVVQAANGRIRVASAPGQGASFTIELPTG